jgi:hypothetical protein
MTASISDSLSEFRATIRANAVRMSTGLPERPARQIEEVLQQVLALNR